MRSIRPLGLAVIVTAVTLGCGAPVPPGEPGDHAADSLVSAELAFARAAEEGDVAEAFLGALADGGVVFRPGPVNGRERFESAPPSDALLAWEPTVAVVSADGTLGFTSGPYRFSPDRSPDAEVAHGHYVSVWRRPPGERWRLVADIGIDHEPGAVMEGPVRTTPGNPEATASYATLLEAERAEVGCADRATSDVRVYRSGRAPAEGVALACELVESTTGMGISDPTGGEIAGSGDLGFTYGTLEGESPTAGPSRFAYLHIWRRESTGWHVLVDVALPWPETPPPS